MNFNDMNLLTAVVFWVPQIAAFRVVGDAVVGAALQQALALPVLVAVALTLRAKVSTGLEVAAVLSSTANSSYPWQLPQGDHHCLT